METKSLEELNKSIDGKLFLPYNLPVHKYIFMPNIGSNEFLMFVAKYVQNHGENLEEFRDKIVSNPIYVVFKITDPHLTYKFHSKNEVDRLNKGII